MQIASNYAPLTSALIKRMESPTPLMRRAFSIPMKLLVENMILPQKAR